MIQRTIFECHDLDQHAQVLADFLPNGRLFEAKNIPDSIYRMFLRGLAHTNEDAESFLCLMDEQLNIDETVDYIEEWEKTVGIPDDCFSNTVDIDTRRQQILVKLAALGVQTEQDFVDLAALYGVDIRIDSGISHGAFTYTFPIVFFDSLKQARFTMIVIYTASQSYAFPYTFTFPFGSPNITIVECLFRKLVPANVDLIFLNEDPIIPDTGGSFSIAFSDDFAT